ncbi:hypothetical protein KCU70_g197, partial [Aureobasidium melanogenum]
MVCGWPYKGVLVDCRSASLSLRSRYSRLRLGRDLCTRYGHEEIAVSHCSNSRVSRRVDVCVFEVGQVMVGVQHGFDTFDVGVAVCRT